MATCEKHAKDPARGYSPCAGCEIERLQSELVDAIKLPTVKALMAKLEPEICVPWRSDCAGQIFLDTGAEDEVRIGHFQGDAALAAYMVEIHNTLLAKITQSAG
ncbi:TPA: hypothetical protein ACSPMB_003143 [Pseudomonas aeruginosa]